MRHLPRAWAPRAHERDRWQLVKVDIDEQLEAAKACNITSIPALVAFVDGRPVSQIVGAVPRARVRKLLDPLRSR